MIAHGCRRRTRSRGGTVGRNTKCACDTQLLLPSVRKALRKLNRGKICAPCMIRGVCAAKRAPSWQDIHVVYPPTAICRAFRMHGAHILPKPAHFGCTARISCQEGAIFPPEAPFGIHGVKKLPRIDARERTAREYCHCQSGQGRIRAQSRHRRTLGNAFREHFAIVERPGTHRGEILPLPVARERISRISRHRRAPGNAWRRYLAIGRHPRMHSFGIPPLPVARSRSALYAREWVQSLGCAVGFGAQRFLCKGVGIPPSLGLIAGNDFESALFRWATMSSLRVLRSCAVLCAEAKSALTFI